MRHRAASFIALALGIALLTGLQATGVRPSSAAAATQTVISPTTTKISHVVVVYQENHSFDEVLGQVCITRVPACNGYVGPVTNADGTIASNVVEPDLVPFVKHSAVDQKHALHNEWDLVRGCQNSPYPCVAHIDPSSIPNLAALADQFTVSDASFAHTHTASWGAHLEIAAGQRAGFNSGVNPVPSVTGVPANPGWGCPSNKDDKWRDGTYEPTCVPDSHGRGPYRPSSVQNVPTAMQWLEKAGRTWHIFEGNYDAPASGNPWEICSYFYWCYEHRWSTTWDSPTKDFIARAGGTTPGLPDVSFMLPSPKFSQHNGDSLAVGDNYIGNIVTAVENGPYWKSTAIFIVYDDCGCFYDHVTPPQGSSFRNPVVIVSPWAKPAGVDSTQADQPYSVLKFIQDNFGLPKLTNNVSQVYDYANAFNFSQQPTKPIAMTHTSISKAERQKIARYAPRVANDTS